MFNMFLILFLCFIFTHQASVQFSTDYSATDLINAFSRLSVLTLGRLLGANDTIGPIEQEVTFFCYNRRTNQFLQTFVNDPNLADKLDVTKPLYLVIHGWLSSVNQNWAKKFRQDMAKFLDVNACAVSWERLANFEYIITAIQHVSLVGDYVTEFISQAFNFGIALDDITLVGHSLGAQISGHVGKNINERLGEKLGVIFGLDPANPHFCLPTVANINKRLDATDAKFVQIIHSSDNAFGCAIDQGHQDFRPDGGNIFQTGCKVPLFGQTIGFDPLICNHYQAVLYFQYSMNPANVFIGRQCASYLGFLLFRCNKVTDVIGPYTKKQTGRFYLRTSAKTPFTPISRTGSLVSDTISS